MNLDTNYFIHFRGIGEDFQVFVQSESSLPQRSAAGISYFYTIDNKTIHIFWSEQAYEIDLPGSWMSLDSLEKLIENQGALLCRALGYFWSFMPASLQELNLSMLPNKFSLKNEDLSKVTFFGGSFYPWHEGHRECIDQAEQFDRNVIVAPDHNPWKDEDGFSCFWQAYKQLVNELADTSFSIYPGFWGLQYGNPTVAWVPQVNLKTKSLLMGDDSFFSLHNWKDVGLLLKSLDSIYVVPREGKTDQRMSQKEKLWRFNPNLEYFFLEKHPHEAISSTKIREMLKSKRQ